MRRKIKSLSPDISPHSAGLRRSYVSKSPLSENHVSASNTLINRAKLEERIFYEKAIENLETKKNSLTSKILNQKNEIQNLTERLRKYEAFTRYYPENDEMIFEEAVENSPFNKKNSPMLLNCLGKKGRVSLSSKPKSLFSPEKKDCQSPVDDIQTCTELKSQKGAISDFQGLHFFESLLFSNDSNSEIFNTINKLQDYLKNSGPRVKAEIIETVSFTICMLRSKFQSYIDQTRKIFGIQQKIIKQFKKKATQSEQISTKKMEIFSKEMSPSSTIQTASPIIKNIKRFEESCSVADLNDNVPKHRPKSPIRQSMKPSYLDTFKKKTDDKENAKIRVHPKTQMKPTPKPPSLSLSFSDTFDHPSHRVILLVTEIRL